MKRTLAALISAVVLGLAAPTAAVAAPAPTVVSTTGPARGPLTGPVTLTVLDAPPGTVKVKWYDLTSGTRYAASASRPPWSWTVTGAPGPRVVQARLLGADGRTTKVGARFTISAGTGTGTATGPRTIDVRTLPQLVSALATARPCDTIAVADGVYASRTRLTALTSGRPGCPITLVGSRAAVLTSTGPRGDYGLWVLGSDWRVVGLTVAHAAKGIVLDHSPRTVLDGVQVTDIGAEGIHVRSDSDHVVVRGSSVHGTGVVTPAYGEGVYVGSARSNWATPQTVPQTGERFTPGGVDGVDRSDFVVVEDNLIADTPAEGIDAKEGTRGGVLRGNRFVHVGWSGANSADSAVDVKGSDNVVDANRVTDTRGLLDGFQTHAPAAGDGTRNVFSRNVVEGPLTGFVVGLHPAAGNVVRCDNSTSGAARGVVGAGAKAVACTP